MHVALFDTDRHTCFVRRDGSTEWAEFSHGSDRLNHLVFEEVKKQVRDILCIKGGTEAVESLMEAMNNE